MTTRYQMKEMPDLQGTGEPITYPKMVMTGQTSTRELAEYIAMTSGFSKGVTEGIICELGEALAHEMGMGRSVKIEGLGVFTPALSIYPDKEHEQPQESTTKRNARSIYVSGVNFRTDKALIRETNHWCELERASWKPAHSSKKYTPEQRLALAHQYLDKHAFLTVSIYRQLTGLVRSTATVELRKWAHTPGSGIDTSGIGSHKVYVKRKESVIP